MPEFSGSVHAFIHEKINKERIVRDSEETPAGTFIETHNNELKYTRFVSWGSLNQKGETQIALTDEIVERLKARNQWSNVFSFVREAMRSAEDDPAGNQSIDPQKDAHNAEDKRIAVHAFSAEAEEFFGRPVAIKMVHRLPNEHDAKRERLPAQFILMRALEQKLAGAPESLRNILSFNTVYAMLRVHGADYLIMERVIDAEWMAHNEDSILVEDHKEFLTALDAYAGGEGLAGRKTIDFLELKELLLKAGFPVTDIAARNILVNRDGAGRKHYTIIDQGSG